MQIRIGNYLFYFLLSFTLAGIVSSCGKLVQVPASVNKIASNSVYTTDATAIAVLTGIYTDMVNSNSTDGAYISGNGGISELAGLSADEFTLYNGVTDLQHIGYYQNTLSAIQGTGSNFWSPLYNFIYRCNATLEGLSASTSLTPGVKQQLQGEAKFLRAFFYFYLVNLFGDVPLTTSTDYTKNSLLTRSSKAQVYQQIISDLKDAVALLSSNYLDPTLLKITTERVRPSRWAAFALLSRTYLYTGDWIDAEADADSVVNNAGTYSLSPLRNAFLKNNPEVIWQLQPVTVGHNTEDGWIFIIPPTGPSNLNGPAGYPVYLSPQLLGSFEINDQRRKIWVDSVKVSGTTYYFPYKYTSDTLNSPVREYLMVLRLGEQYLIRAEARAQQNNTLGSQSDLNSIRTRAGLLGATATDQASLLTAILHERQVELFTEWGHRWLDLKRTGTIDVVMNQVTPLKTNNVNPWQSYQQLYPILLNDLQKDPNLLQNSGY